MPSLPEEISLDFAFDEPTDEAHLTGRLLACVELTDATIATRGRRAA